MLLFMIHWARFSLITFPLHVMGLVCANSYGTWCSNQHNRCFQRLFQCSYFQRLRFQCCNVGFYELRGVISSSFVKSVHVQKLLLLGEKVAVHQLPDPLQCTFPTHTVRTPPHRHGIWYVRCAYAALYVYRKREALLSCIAFHSLSRALASIWLAHLIGLKQSLSVAIVTTRTLLQLIQHVPVQM